MRWWVVPAIVLVAATGATVDTVRWRQADGNRTYWPVTIAQLASGKVKHTHVAVTGRVVLVKHERDGDTHLRLRDDSLRFIVAECIPALRCPVPALGNVVTVQGISRYDGEHRWWEVHPVENLVDRGR